MYCVSVVSGVCEVCVCGVVVCECLHEGVCV